LEQASYHRTETHQVSLDDQGAGAGEGRVYGTSS
jgi:hypothetical protein